MQDNEIPICDSIPFFKKVDLYLDRLDEKNKNELIFKQRKREERQRTIFKKLEKIKAQIPFFYKDLRKICYFQEQLINLERLSLIVILNCQKKLIDHKNGQFKENCNKADGKIANKKDKMELALYENRKKVEAKWIFFKDFIPDLILNCSNSTNWKTYE